MAGVLTRHREFLLGGSITHKIYQGNYIILADLKSHIRLHIRIWQWSERQVFIWRPFKKKKIMYRSFSHDQKRILSTFGNITYIDLSIQCLMNRDTLYWIIMSLDFRKEALHDYYRTFLTWDSQFRNHFLLLSVFSFIGTRVFRCLSKAEDFRFLSFPHLFLMLLKYEYS